MIDQTASGGHRRAELLRSHMEILKVRFVQRAGDDAAEMLDSLDRGDRAGLGDRAHRLAGIAATFGYPAIGEEASVLQKVIAEEPLEADLGVAVRRLVELLEMCNLPPDSGKARPT